MNERYEIIVSIINYRTADLTINCAKSVLEAIGGIRARIVIVDNLSSDGSVEELSAWIASLGPDSVVDLVCSPTNSGFSGGHNQGMSLYDAEFYFLLNSDAKVLPECFDYLLNAARKYPDCGMYCPKIEYDDGTQQMSCFRIPTPISELLRGASTRQVTALFKNYDVAIAVPPKQDLIEWASFAGIMISSAVVRDVGRMDEGFFLYFEDVAYCYHARQKGWRIRYVPDARIVHFRGGSGPVKALQANRRRLPRYYYASRTRLFYLMYGAAGVTAANLLYMAGRLIANIRRFFGRPVPPSNDKELFDVWTNFLQPLSANHSPDRKEEKGN